MDHAARRRLIHLLLRSGAIGGQPQADTAHAAGDRRDVRRVEADTRVARDGQHPPPPSGRG